MKAYLGLGSNIGEREDNLQTAITLLKRSIEVIRRSKTLETEPFGLVDQPDFLNLVLEIETDLTPKELLTLCLLTEQEMGRKREIKWGPRNIDIDILLYEDIVLNEKDLIIPHQYLTERDFVLIPLTELSPDIVHPITGKTMSEHLKELKRI